MAALRTIRRHQLLSQRDLAKLAGITASTVYLVESGRTAPHFKVMRAVCAALGMQPSEVDEFRAVLEPIPAPTRQAA